MIRRPPRSTLDRSSAASDVYKRQGQLGPEHQDQRRPAGRRDLRVRRRRGRGGLPLLAVSYTHLRAHETVLDLVCRLLLEKKNNNDEVHTASIALELIRG